MKIDQEDIYNIFRGKAILFLGAGFSLSNLNSKGEKLPSARTLSKELQRESGISESEIDENIDLGVASEFFIKEVGSSQLVSLLKEKFTVSNVLDWQKNLMSLPWSRIYTTNYDNVVELSSTLVGCHRKTIDVGVPTKDYKLSNTVIHINGYVDNISIENLRDSTKLTSESYADTNFINSSWNTELTQSFKHASSIFFIGFSMNYDLDLKRIVASQEQIRKKVYFINGKISQIHRVPLEKFGRVTELDGEQFAQTIMAEKEHYVPLDSSGAMRTYSFLPSKLKFISDEVSSKDVMELFISGKVNQNLLFSNCNSSNYVFFRNQINTILDNIDDYDLFAILSYLGNGKTIFLKLLESSLVQKGYSVFVYSKGSDEIYDDIEVLNSLTVDKCCVIIDDYYSLQSNFRLLRRLDRKFKLIISGRRTIHGNLVDLFKKSVDISDSKTFTVNLDRVDDSEQQKIQKIIENSNFWGDFSSRTDEEKKRYIQNHSKKGISEFMVEFFRSTNVLNKYYEEYQGIPSSIKELVLLILVDNILSLGLDVQDILKLTNNTGISDQARLNTNLNEFIDIDRDLIIFKSAIASRELLKKETDRRFIVELLSKVLANAIKFDKEKKYEYLKRMIISFSNFKLLNEDLDRDELNRLAVTYYENIQNYPFTKQNPFFWLQFGIQRLDEKRYDLADRYFDNALSYAKSTGMTDFYQINAQKARGFIENIVENKKEITEAFKIMVEAHRLLIRDLDNRRNNRSYQLSQGNLYRQFHDEYKNELDPINSLKFKSMVHTFREKVEKYLSDIGWSPKVEESLKEINKID